MELKDDKGLQYILFGLLLIVIGSIGKLVVFGCKGIEMDYNKAVVIIFSVLMVAIVLMTVFGK